MPTLRLSFLGALCMTPLAVTAIDNEYDGFYHFHNWDGNVNDIAQLTLPDGGGWESNFAKDICSKDSECTTVGGDNPLLNTFRTLSDNSDFDMYLAWNTTTVPSAICAFEDGGAYVPTQHYLHCKNDFGGGGVQGYILNTFALPPDIIHSTCLSNPKCIGFRVKNDQSSGDILGSPSACCEGFFAVSRSNTVKHVNTRGFK